VALIYNLPTSRLPPLGASHPTDPLAPLYKTQRQHRRGLARTMTTSELSAESSLLACVLGFPGKTDAEIDDFTDLFIRRNIDAGMNYQDEQGRCPLGVAATMAGRAMLDFVKALVTGNNSGLVKLRLKDARLRTPLLLAAEHNRTEIFLYLLERLSQCERGWQLAEEEDCYLRGPLHYTCQHQNAAGVRAVLAVAQGAPPVGSKVGEEEEEKKKERIQTVVNARTSSGETPLFWLVQSLSASQEEDAGVEEGGKQKKKKSSSSSSSSINDDAAAAVLEIAELLLATGADPQVGNAMGQTPMDLLKEGKDGREGGVKGRLRALLSSRKASKEEGEEEEEEKKVKDERGIGSSTNAAGLSSSHTAAVAPGRGMLASFPTRGRGFGASSTSSSSSTTTTSSTTSSSTIGSSSSSRSGGSAPIYKKLKIKLKAPAAKEEDK